MPPGRGPQHLAVAGRGSQFQPLPTCRSRFLPFRCSGFWGTINGRNTYWCLFWTNTRIRLIMRREEGPDAAPPTQGGQTGFARADRRQTNERSPGRTFRGKHMQRLFQGLQTTQKVHNWHRDEGETNNSRLKKLGQKRKDKKIKVVYLIDWIPSIGRCFLYLQGGRSCPVRNLFTDLNLQISLITL